MSVSLPSNRRSERENEDGPGGATNTDRDLTSPLLRADKEADVDIIATRSDRTDQDPETRARLAGEIPPEDAVPVLQHLLARAIMAREKALAEVERVHSGNVDRHWFVQAEGGYCAACGLPSENRRHAPRAA